jgi:hypothetical protein
MGNYGLGLSQEELLIPSLLKLSAISSATGCFAKWNIRSAAGSLRLDRGFDEFIEHASGK